MPEQVKRWICVTCEAEYETEGEAAACEREHTALEELNVVDVHYPPEYKEYPLHVWLEHQAGSAGIYKLIFSGSVEDMIVTWESLKRVEHDMPL